MRQFDGSTVCLGEVGIFGFDVDDFACVNGIIGIFFRSCFFTAHISAQTARGNHAEPLESVKEHLLDARDDGPSSPVEASTHRALEKRNTPLVQPRTLPLFPFPFPCFFFALGTHNAMAGILHLSNSTLPSSELQEHMAPILRARHARIAGFAGPVRAKQYDRFDGFMPPPSAQQCFVSPVSSSPLPPAVSAAEAAWWDRQAWFLRPGMPIRREISPMSVLTDEDKTRLS